MAKFGWKEDLVSKWSEICEKQVIIFEIISKFNRLPLMEAQHDLHLMNFGIICESKLNFVIVETVTKLLKVSLQISKRYTS